MSNKLSTVSFNSKVKENDVNKLFPESVMCQMLHKMEALEGGKFGFVKMIMLDNQLAAELLKINTRNRSLNTERSKSYREMMDACVWCVGADALVVSDNDIVVNGGHRLVAKLESSTPVIPVIVRYGVNWDEFTYIDKQRVRNNATSVGIDMELDRVIKMFYRIGLDCNQVSVYRAQLAAECLRETYAWSKTVDTKKSKVFNRATLSAFMLAWQTAKTSEDKHFALNKWRVFNVGKTGPSGHEDDVHTEYMQAVREDVIGTDRNAWKPAYVMFKRAYMVFLPGKHQNKSNFVINGITDDKAKQLVSKCFNTTV